ncbi:2-amino-4-hydroxy-6-hydroxymethyldihydropteridine diphosphokinase [Riemerella columbina]|uniref:2-amino-4-hydroxy-6- hydroxymethyldihydropteridine diphosphokinase n=1 Tax=Riemerella columbina TaxID=103810 RepID=UPI00036246E3|nr:2-amino-4-hydroxy-6-hydroxymethyldihydropteridine diphosphokinase [Riemerella columbina]
MSQKEVILLLGSNLGDTKKNIETAIQLINNKIGIIKKRSFFLKTEPVEFVSNNIFSNIALSINTDLSPIQILKQIKDIEIVMGRTQDSSILGEYKDRIIDIDIVMIGKIRFKSILLTIPHQKHLFTREFSKILIDQII